MTVKLRLPLVFGLLLVLMLVTSLVGVGKVNVIDTALTQANELVSRCL